MGSFGKVNILVPKELLLLLDEGEARNEFLQAFEGYKWDYDN